MNISSVKKTVKEKNIIVWETEQITMYFFVVARESYAGVMVHILCLKNWH